MLGGSGGMLPRENLDKNGTIWCNLGVPKYAITKLKNFLRLNNQQQQKLIAIFFPEVNIDVRFTKINTFRSYKGGLGGGLPPEAEEIFKNQTKWRLFLKFFFAFWQSSLDPQNYELAPQLP